MQVLCQLKLPLLAFAMLTLVTGCGLSNPHPIKPDTSAIQKVTPSRFQFQGYNLVFVSFDALQASHVGLFGYPRKVTPTLDEIANESYSFSRVTSVASWTVPASMTWFTGVYPSEHRMTNKFSVYNATEQHPANLRELSPDLMTLAEVLKLNGYATGGFTGNAGVSGGFGYDQGFDTYFYEKGKFGGFDRSIPKAIEWLKSHKDQKFFLFLHGYDCHGQNTPSEGFDYRYVDPGYDQRYTGTEQEQELLREEGLARGFVTLRDEDVRFWRAVYDEKINRADARFRDFLAEFDKLGISDKTLFVLTSDHGTELYEHRRLDHGFTLYQEQLHVPLIVKLPGHTIGKMISDRISSIDVMPTILELLQIDASSVKQSLRGISLVNAMNGDKSSHDCFSETDYREYTFKRSIVTTDGKKLILTLESKTRELFDLEIDPGETINVADSQSSLADDLERRLRAHFQSIGCDLSTRQWQTGLNPVYPSQATPKTP
ncbi:MAG: sulfatase [Planctomycetota bacterium]